MIKNQALMQGFVVAQFADHFKEASEQLAQWVSEGKIKFEVTIDEGLTIYLLHLESYSQERILVNKLSKSLKNRRL